MNIIESERLILRPFRESDLNDFYEYAKNPNVGPNAGWKPHESKEESLVILKKFIKREDVWAIEEKISSKVIGSISLLPDRHRNYEQAKMLAYVLNVSYWGKGYMTEAVVSLVRYAFEVMKLLVLSADHYPFNQHSRKVIEKCGFLYEGTVRYAAKLYNGEIYDIICYYMTRSTYRTNCERELYINSKFRRIVNV